MAEVIVTFKIMPSGVNASLNNVQEKVAEIIGNEGRVEGVEVRPVAFGIKSLLVYCVFEESIGGKVDEFAEEIVKVSGVETCEVVDVRRAIDLE